MSNEFKQPEFDAQKIIDEHGSKCKTRDGRDVEQLTLFTGVNEKYPIRGVVGNALESWAANGSYISGGSASQMDLIMPRTLVSEWWTATANGAWWAHFSDLSSAQGAVSNVPAKLFHTAVYSDDTVESEVVK